MPSHCLYCGARVGVFRHLLAPLVELVKDESVLFTYSSDKWVHFIFKTGVAGVWVDEEVWMCPKCSMMTPSQKKKQFLRSEAVRWIGKLGFCTCCLGTNYQGEWKSLGGDMDVYLCTCKDCGARWQP